MKRTTYRLTYRPDLEGLRAISILLVVAAHAGVPWLQGGFVGVDVFFVLSGFLITGLIVREASDNGSFDFINFYIRRFRRLLPALLVMLLIITGLAAFFLSPAEQKEQSSSAAMAALWLSNFKFGLSLLDYFSASHETNLFLHTWSLGVEEQFYLIWPALLIWLFMESGKQKIKRLKIGMMVVAVASLIACIIVTYKAPQLSFYMMPMRVWQFASGALVWLFINESGIPKSDRADRQWLLAAIGWAGLSAVIIAGIFFSDELAYPGYYALLPSLGAAGIIAANCKTGPTLGSASRLLSLPPLQWLGSISYSWYLWHWPILVLGEAITGTDKPIYRLFWIALSFALAWLSYRFIETPIRRQQWWLSNRIWTISSSLSLMIVASILFIAWHNHASEATHSPTMRKYLLAHNDAPIIYQMGCDDWYHSAEVKICAFGNPDATHTAVLMGDSHAGQWFPAVAKVFQNPEWKLLVLTKSSCPMVNAPFFYKRIGKEYTVCSKWRQNALARITTLKPDIVILGSADNSQYSKKQWINGTTDVLVKLSSSSKRVYILRDTPSLSFNGPNCLAKHARRPDWLSLQHTCRASAFNRHSDRIYSWLKESAQGFDNVSMLDMNNYVCPQSICSATQQGIIVFRDSQHLTASYAASLGHKLAEKLSIETINNKNF